VPGVALIPGYNLQHNIRAFRSRGPQTSFTPYGWWLIATRLGLDRETMILRRRGQSHDANHVPHLECYRRA
jgi:hypothetical protein